MGIDGQRTVSCSAQTVKDMRADMWKFHKPPHSTHIVVGGKWECGDREK